MIEVSPGIRHEVSDGVTQLPRVAVVASHPIQHFVPLYVALSADARIRLRVFFGSTAGVRPYYDRDFATTIKWAGNLTGGYDFEFLPGAENIDVSSRVNSRSLPGRLDAWNPDVVQVYGFWHGISRTGLLWAKRNRRRTLVFADSELLTRRTWLTRARKRLLVPLLLRLADQFLTIGDRNEDYYRHYGATTERFVRSPYPIDTNLLDSVWEDRVARRQRVREGLGISTNALMLLTVGKLTARKRTADVLLAVARIGDRCGQPIVAVLVGDGPERSRLEALAKTIGHHRVRMLGFVNTDKLADYYVASDILVHPSQEDPHPLATSEAVFCGLPVVASDRVGSVGPTDDVRPGENGRQYPVGNIDKLAGCIELLAMDESLRSELSSRSREIGRERSLQVSVDGFVRAVQTVCGHTSKPS